MGLPGVAHAGEEGPPAYIWEALDVLRGAAHRSRRALPGGRPPRRAAGGGADPAHRVPVLQREAPGLSRRWRQHDLPALVRRGLLVTINSDDPAYFGGYVADNLRRVAEAFDLGREAIAELARNSFRAAFLPDPVKDGYLAEVDRLGAECRPTASPRARHDGPVAKAGIAGLVLTPGASAGREQSGLVAIDEAVTRPGVAVERVEFPGQAAGKRRTDPPAVCIETVRTATAALAERLWRPDRPHRHRRPLLRRPDVLPGRGRGPAGGRARPGQLPAPSAGSPRTPPHRALPRAATCPASSSRVGATPSPRPRSSSGRPPPSRARSPRHFVDGDHSLRKSEAEVAEIVAVVGRRAARRT